MRILTAVVGSFPQPGWLLDRDVFLGRLPARVQIDELWTVKPEVLEEAQDDATILAIRAQERAGIDIVTDGEMRRLSYSSVLASSLGGIDRERTGVVVGRAGKPNNVPLISGPLTHERSVHERDVRFLRANTDRTVKVTIPGPFTLTQLCVDEYYGSEEAVAMAYAETINKEVRILFEAGADIVQLDEPYLQAKPEQASRYAVPAINKALEGITGTTALHVCFGYAAMVKDKSASGYSCIDQLNDTIAQQVSIETAQPKLDPALLKLLPSKTVMVGVIDLNDPNPETPEVVADRLRRALDHLPPERMIAAPDCGMKYLTRDQAFGKLKALAEGAAIVSSEL
ncbi:MAG: 5-methyltetrahydropteroyltriglutamate--homocysteine methyltransferase [Gammaproteobacteria bacterium]|nr:5-methyltetrahydropteroyltriglutamate--homocysteine methyltransferase [Gammaproteobacteria bacterium]